MNAEVVTPREVSVFGAGTSFSFPPWPWSPELSKAVWVLPMEDVTDHGTSSFVAGDVGVASGVPTRAENRGYWG